MNKRDGIAYGAAVPFVFVSDWACPFNLLTGLPCPGCGSTRAFLALMSGDLERAIAYNSLLFIAPIILVAMYFFFRNFARRNTLLVSTTVILVLGFTFYRWTNLESWVGAL
jgi:hypothetical protein